MGIECAVGVVAGCGEGKEGGVGGVEGGDGGGEGARLEDRDEVDGGCVGGGDERFLGKECGAGEGADKTGEAVEVGFVGMLGWRRGDGE